MHRTQISLEHQQYEALQRESRRRQISLSAIVRELVTERFLSSSVEKSPLLDLAGIASGTGEAVGRNHNRFLYGKDDEHL